MHQQYSVLITRNRHQWQCRCITHHAQQQCAPQVAALALLTTLVSKCKSPADFKLEPAAQLPVPKWAKPGMEWGPRDDAALLAGVAVHGLNSWERIINDPSLGLKTKLAGAWRWLVGLLCFALLCSLYTALSAYPELRLL